MISALSHKGNEDYYSYSNQFFSIAWVTNVVTSFSILASGNFACKLLRHL